MNSDGAAFLGQANDVLLYFFAGCHHQVGHFVGHDHHERQLLGNGLPLGFAGGLNSFAKFLFAELVVDGYVAHARASQQLVSLLHLIDRPSENRFRLAHVGHHRVHQVRQLTIAAQFDHLGVDHQHPHLVWPAVHEYRDDNRVEADALARARATGDQQMREGRKIHDQRIAGNVLAQVNGDFHPLCPTVGHFDHVAQPHNLAVVVGHFDADRILARNRRNNAHAGHPQGDRQVVGQVRDLGQTQTRFELDLILSNHGAGFDFDDLDVEAEVAERLFQQLRLAAHLTFVLLVGDVVRLQEQVQRREFVVVGRVDSLLGGLELVDHLLAFGLFGGLFLLFDA